jgi:hypothetical protein
MLHFPCSFFAKTMGAWNWLVRELLQGTKGKDTPQFPLDLEGLVPCCISEEENDQLVTPPSPEEVKAAVLAMKSNKAPGPDGMSPIFYKHYWHIIGGDIIEVVRSFFIQGYMLREVNQFRPISLCNVIYKTISKILANCLSPSFIS